MRGHPVQILHAKDHGYELDAKALDEILLAEKIQDKKGSPEWMGDPEEPLKGFSWKSGWKGHTAGILMWSEVFIVKTAKNEEVAVILMDTQGAFDTNYDMGECATVFALSTMVSSVQVYNISQNIQETDLHHLQLFVEYGRIAQEKNASNIPFQKLQFLVRDWRHVKELKCGINGGREYLNQILSSSGREKAELKKVRQHIKTSFSDISCFLMPYPGEAVAGDSDFDGRLSGISETFIKELKNYVPLLLAPQNLVTKNIGGIDVTAKELCNYFKVYIAMFQGDKLPTPYTIYEATAHANNQLAIKRAKDHYKDKMEMIYNWDSPLIHSKQLDEEHLKLVQSTMMLFRSTRKMGQKDISSIYEQELKADLEAMKAKYKKINEEKLKMEETKLKYMKEQEELRQTIDNMETERRTVIDMMKQKEEDHSMKQEEFKKYIESFRQEKERMQQELEEARITGKANQAELKETLEKYLKQTERMHDAQKQNERDFSKEQDEWRRRLENVELDKERMIRQIAEIEMARKMDAMKAQYEKELKELKELRDEVQKRKEPSKCTVS